MIVVSVPTFTPVKPDPFPTKEPLNEPDTPVEFVKSTNELDTRRDPVITAEPLNGNPTPPPPPALIHFEPVTVEDNT